MVEYEQRISHLSRELDSFIGDHEDKAPETQNAFEIYIQGFLDILGGIVAVLREAQSVNDSSLPILAKQAEQVFNKAIDFAYQDDPMGPYSESHMPSFAHTEEIAPLLKDERQEGEFSHGFTSNILPHLDSFLEIFGSTVTASSVRAQLKLPPAWKKTIRPHPSSTPCARFRDVIPEWTATETNNRATAVFEARCEISSGDIPNPIDLRMSPSGNILAISSMGGWKNRTPFIYYYLPNHEAETASGFMKEHSITADLMSGVDDIMIDDQRRLIFAADWGRVKTYQCNDPTVRGSKPKAVHTLDSTDYAGPLAMLPNGRVLRAGKKNIAVWNLDTLETHGESGKDMIGRKIKMDTWRDDPENIEPSTGSAPSTTITLDNENDGEGFVIGEWHQHPSQANIMLCGTDFDRDANQGTYYCRAFDLEVGGRAVTRYLGHGGSVDGFSTSAADPNVFLTWCSDGHARLYDVRQSLPVLTIASASHLEPLPAAVLAHPVGIPFIFVGTESSEHIKLWDVRAQKSVYELATGNNSVNAMTWNANSNSLYVTTSCPYIDRNGRSFDYRAARIPRVRTGSGSEDESDGEDNEEDEDEDEYDDDDNDTCWPKKAHHSENYFGHVFDAGDHRFYKFSFKMDANPEILPYYGSGSMGGGGW